MKHMLFSYVVICFFCVAFTATIPLHKKALDPNHVPSSVCESMVPLHNDSVPSTDPSPYEITTTMKKASPGEVIEVLIKGIDGKKFLGLYMQVRVFESGPEAVGTFLEENLQVNPAIRISTCPPGTQNAISYISREPIDKLQLKWKVPADFSGKIYFRGTFVQSFSVFWVNVDSELIEISI